MTEPSQYFKGRTVQEQMNEVIGYVDVRSAEVATDAIAADVAQVHQDMLDADADASAAAASAAAAAGTLANAVKKTGEASQSIAGDVSVAGNLTGDTVTVPTPVNNTDAATKKYVDDADALKADKTYVDGQDALKISIADINQYAVGLTGEQLVDGPKINQSGYSWVVKSVTDENNVQPGSTIFYPLFAWFDKNNHPTCTLVLSHSDTHKLRLYVRLLKWDPNTNQDVEVANSTLVVEP